MDNHINDCSFLGEVTAISRLFYLIEHSKMKYLELYVGLLKN